MLSPLSLFTNKSTSMKGPDILSILWQIEPTECTIDERYCYDRDLYRLLMGQINLILFVLGIVGNCINLFVYHIKQMRHYIAIRLLSTKVLMNTLFIICLLPQAVRITSSRLSINSDTDSQWTLINQMYWYTWPYQTYLINVFGFNAIWLTVLMTAECYIHVFFPIQSKIICTQTNVNKCYVIIGCISMLLPIIYPLNRIVRKIQCNNGTIVFQIKTRPNIILESIESMCAIANLLSAIILPLLLLIFMSLSIAWRLICCTVSNQHFIREKRCVTRIALLTTALQLITELPAVPVFILVLWYGPSAVHTLHLCYWHTLAHFLAVCNASLSFFVYMLLSERFRSLVSNNIRQLCGIKTPSVRNDDIHLIDKQLIETMPTDLSTRGVSS